MGHTPDGGTGQRESAEGRKDGSPCISTSPTRPPSESAGSGLARTLSDPDALTDLAMSRSIWAHLFCDVSSAVSRCPNSERYVPGKWQGFRIQRRGGSKAARATPRHHAHEQKEGAHNGAWGGVHVRAEAVGATREMASRRSRWDTGSCRRADGPYWRVHGKETFIISNTAGTYASPRAQDQERGYVQGSLARTGTWAGGKHRSSSRRG